MATGGIFQLITNDGKQDKMLMASELLRNRLAAVTAARQANPAIADPTPTLLDIEKTHILFTNAHFKPFAAIGFEYNKTNAASGNSTMGSSVTFSIPQFGDFFHDMVLYVQLNQPVLTVTAASLSDAPLMRWCPYPGERLLETVEFEVNGNPLDKYYNNDVNFHREFSIQPNKLAGWKRCVGQEEGHQGYVNQPSWANSGVDPATINYRVGTTVFSGDQTPSGQKDITKSKELIIPLLFWCNRDVRLAVPSVAIPYGQRFIKVQLTAANNLVNLVPRGAGDWTDANIGGSLNYNNMLQNIVLYINNIFVNPEVHNIFIKRIGFTLIRVHRQQTLNATATTAEVLLQQLKWPIESLFIGMKMAQYNATDVVNQRQFLDRWHTFSLLNDTTVSTQGYLSGQSTLKNAAFVLPTSTVNVSAAATANLRFTSTATVVAGANPYEGINTGDFITVTFTGVSTPAVTAGPIVLEVASVIPSSDSTSKGYVVFKNLVGSVTAALGTSAITLTAATVSVSATAFAPAASTYSARVNTIDSMTIAAHGIPIYNGFTTKFHNAYIPYHYGGPNITVPEDTGALMVPFGLYPGTYQPSGHINVSRAREFYLSYTSSVIGATTGPYAGSSGTLVVCASAINFLLISDGSAVLRYST
jgi:hypothetical protein